MRRRNAGQVEHAEEIRLYTSQQAARLMGLSVKTLANWRSDGTVEIPFVKIGRAVRYRHVDIAAFIKSRTFLNAHEVKSSGRQSKRISQPSSTEKRVSRRRKVVGLTGRKIVPKE